MPITKHTMTTLEYKGFRIEATSVGKGWRASIFEPGSNRALADSPFNLRRVPAKKSLRRPGALSMRAFYLSIRTPKCCHSRPPFCLTTAPLSGGVSRHYPLSTTARTAVIDPSSIDCCAWLLIDPVVPKRAAAPDDQHGVAGLDHASAMGACFLVISAAAILHASRLKCLKVP